MNCWSRQVSWRVLYLLAYLLTHGSFTYLLKHVYKSDDACVQNCQLTYSCNKWTWRRTTSPRGQSIHSHTFCSLQFTCTSWICSKRRYWNLLFPARAEGCIPLGLLIMTEAETNGWIQRTISNSIFLFTKGGWGWKRWPQPCDLQLDLAYEKWHLL
jgi:hypothetical protein